MKSTSKKPPSSAKAKGKSNMAAVPSCAEAGEKREPDHTARVSEPQALDDDPWKLGHGHLPRHLFSANATPYGTPWSYPPQHMAFGSYTGFRSPYPFQPSTEGHGMFWDLESVNSSAHASQGHASSVGEHEMSEEEEEDGAPTPAAIETPKRSKEGKFDDFLREQLEESQTSDLAP